VVFPTPSIPSNVINNLLPIDRFIYTIRYVKGMLLLGKGVLKRHKSVKKLYDARGVKPSIINMLGEGTYIAYNKES
jgi:hypothetical protein